jgi:hypothetical protein
MSDVKFACDVFIVVGIGKVVCVYVIEKSIPGDCISVSDA